ncbi:MAG: DNA repair protein RadA [Clostridia bacterium]|nr:DNA repair protein RadA [Clostridia bacterium]
MAKAKSLYICSSCGYESAKWYGCCPGCGEWNTMNEEAIVQHSSRSTVNVKPAVSLTLDKIINDSSVRYKTGLGEFDRVLGGGIVKGSLILLSGDPGIGKSTILLQICQYLDKSLNILYISGEESAHQIKMRAERLGVNNPALSVMCEIDVISITEYIRTQKPDIVIVDSIQTMDYSEVSSSPGSVTQVRESASVFMRTAKSLGIPVILVGHVNKDGNIAGPKVLEHIVDAVLYFEGNRNFSYRILRAVKNRYGSTNEIGVFEMCEQGLAEVENPSLMLISGKPKNTPGSCIACVMEGSRPIMAEVQALVTPTGFGNPRRMSTGFDYNRVSMLLAVLEKRAGYFFGTTDTYINVVGGLKLDEPASDLSVAMALISSLKDTVVSDDTLAFGEIGLAGEVRGVSNCEQRVREAVRLGFSRCIIPQHNLKNLSLRISGDTEIIGVRNIREAFEAAVK